MTQTIPDLKGFVEYFGVRVAILGDDGDLMVALGHVNPYRFTAAFNRYVRRMLGWRSLAYEAELSSYDEWAKQIKHQWAVLRTECVDHEGERDPDCSDCAEIASYTDNGSWWIGCDAREGEPGAFPVTVRMG